MQNDWKDLLASLRKEHGEDKISEETPLEIEEKNEKRSLGKLNIVVERKGRGGKTATIIEGFTIPDDEVAEIAARMKQQFGTGGSSRGGEILLQGDWREKAKQFLKDLKK